MIEKFKDPSHGKRRILECLSTQTLVANDKSLAECLSDVCSLKQLSPEDILIHQDGEDSDLYFVLSGSLSVVINGREVAVRKAGNHVGEMALIDPASKRSATVVAKEVTVVACVKEGDFAEIGNRFPLVWRRIAVELGHRLRDRSIFIKRPNTKPMIFIGSSSENLDLANLIKDSIFDSNNDVKVWSEPGVFELTKSALDSLIETARSYDFAILIFDQNDVITSREVESCVPRDNVIFELGLFLGSIGAERSFIIRPKSTDLKIPSDLLGITMLTWDTGDRDSSIKGQCALIKQVIEKLGPK